MKFNCFINFTLITFDVFSSSGCVVLCIYIICRESGPATIQADTINRYNAADHSQDRDEARLRKFDKFKTILKV